MATVPNDNQAGSHPASSQPGHPLVFVLGPPGAGKSTLCKRLASDFDTFNIYHFPVGDRLREYVERHNDPEAQNLKEWLNRQELIPANQIIPWFQRELRSLLFQGTSEEPLRFLIDGFPRDGWQGEYFEKHIASPAVVLFFRCPKQEARERFLRRKRTEDDTADMFEKRYREFAMKNPHILARYGSAGCLVEVDTSAGIDDAYAKLIVRLKSNSAWCDMVGWPVSNDEDESSRKRIKLG